MSSNNYFHNSGSGIHIVVLQIFYKNMQSIKTLISEKSVDYSQRRGKKNDTAQSTSSAVVKNS